MAVYTHVSAEAASALLARYDVGKLVAMKGIAEGVQNSNFLLETDRSRYILTLYETRIDTSDLPYFHDLLAHLHRRGCRVPRFIEDKNGEWLQDVADRKGCLIEFLSGVSVSDPNITVAYNVGRALAEMHAAVDGFSQSRPNPLGQSSWRAMFEKCRVQDIETLQQQLSARIAAECDFLEQYWPKGLVESAVHTDLFPDNVLTLDGAVTGLIDFYFACTDARAFDLAVTHCAWSFSADGTYFDADIGRAIIDGYVSVIDLDDAEKAALPILARGACLRFLLTRLYDWFNTPADALVSRKDPIAFLRRLDHYTQHGLSA